jgi:hypothetical protein
MKEVWVGTWGGKAFRITVRLGKIIKADYDYPPWAKGMRIRHFKRTIWKGHGDVEREVNESRTIEVSPPPGETEKESEQEDVSQEEIEAAPSEIMQVVGGLRLDDPVPEVRDTSRREDPVPEVRPRKRRGVRIFPGMSLRKALKAAHRLGCEISIPRRSGEVRIDHPKMKERQNVNSRRKDAPRALTCALLQLQAELTS